MSTKAMFFTEIARPPNTFIGGIGASVTNTALLAAKLGISEGLISSFSLDSLDVSCHISADYDLGVSAFHNDTEITFFNDAEGKVQQSLAFTFRNAPNLVSSILPVCTHFAGANYYGCSSLVTSIAPLADYFGWSMYQDCVNLEVINAPLLTTAIVGAFTNLFKLTSITLSSLAINAAVFTDARVLVNLSLPALIDSSLVGTYKDCFLLETINLPECTTFKASQLTLSSNITSIYLPKCVNFGTVPYTIGAWWATAVGITWTLPVFLQTSNGGGVDENVQGLINDFGAIIIYV